MRTSALVLALILSIIIAAPASANSVGSSTMEFEGTLTDAGGGVYTGTIDAVAGSWYAVGGGGEAISTAGGFDVYAKTGGCAFVEGYYGTGAWNCSGTDTYTIGYGTSDPHDGYPDDGTGSPPWGGFWNPDVADYYNYELVLTGTTWALQYKSVHQGTPMSGLMDWTNMYASENDVGSYTGTLPTDPDANDGDCYAHGAGAGWWDMDWTWGSDAIPLQFGGFDVEIIAGDGGIYQVTLTPAAPPEVWVDDDFTSATPGWGITHFDLIQNGVDAVLDGGTVNVAAGHYVEEILVEKPVTMLGATHALNKNGYTVPADYAWDPGVETIISHPDPAGSYTAIVDIYDVSDVTFKGFIVQELAAEANKNTSLVRVYAHTGVIENIVFENNIVGPNTNVVSQDGTHGRMGLYLVNHPYGDDGIESSSFSHNKIFDCKGNGDNVFLWTSYYAYGAPGPASMAGTVIDDNEIYGSHRAGIETAGGYADLVISNNDIYGCTGLPGDDPDFLKYGHGIQLIRGSSDKVSDPLTAYGPVNLTIVGNDIHDNQKCGIYMGPKNDSIFIDDNAIYDNGWNGIMLDLEGNYWNPQFESPPSSGQYACYDCATDINGSGNAIYGNGHLGNPLAHYGVQVVGTPTNGLVIDAELNWWDDADGPTTGRAGDAVTDNVDYSPWFAAPPGTSPMPLGTKDSIQDAIDAATSGATINVAAGTYPEQLLIDKSLSLIGAGETATLIEPGAYPVIDVTADDVTISDLAISDPAELTEGIQVNSSADLTLTRVNFPNLGAGAGPNTYGVHLMGDFAGLTVTDCEFDASVASLGVYTRNIGIFAPNSLSLSDFSITDCTFNEMWTSIYLRSGIDGLDVTGCAFGPVDPADYTACVAGLYIGDGDDDDFDLRNISVTGNTFTEYGRGVYVWNYGANSTVENFVISGNTFTNTGWSAAIRFIFGLNGMEDYSIDGLDINNNTFTQDTDVGAYVGMIDLRTYDATLLACDISVTDNVMTFTGAPYADAMYGIGFTVGGDGFYNTTVARNGVDGGGTGGAGTMAAAGMKISHYADSYTWAHDLDIDILSNAVKGFDHALSVYDIIGASYGGLPAGTDVSLSYNSLLGDLYGVRNDDGVAVDAEGNWWGDATGPYHSSNTGGLGCEVSDFVDFDPWIGKAGSENIVCVPDDIELNDTDDDETISVDYLGGASGLIYGVSVTFTWGADVSMDGVAIGDIFPGVAGNDFFTHYGDIGVGSTTASHTVDWTLLGNQAGVTGPATLFTIDLSAAGCGSDDISITSVLFRDNANQPLSGVYASGASIEVDTEVPAVATLSVDNPDNPYFDNWARDGNDLVIEATVTDACGDLDDVTVVANLSTLLDGGGTAVAPSTYATGTATWNLDDADLGADGAQVVRVTVTDLLGNTSYDEITVNVDNTLPVAVTDLAAAPGHNKADLTWTDSPTTYDANFHEYVLRSNAWGDAGYPTYPLAGTPAYPTDAGDGDLVDENVTGGSYGATYASDGSERSILYYGVFARDKAGNYGPAGTGDRCTNYWLGDVAGALGGGVGGYNGRVNDADINILGGTYGVSTGGLGWEPECNVGPTDDNSRVGVPVPDGIVSFEDLMIFAMNYDVVAPRIVPFLAEPSVGGLALALNEADRSSDGVLSLALRLEGNLGEIKGLSTELEFDGLEFIAAGLSDEMSAPVADVFFWSDATSRSTQIDLAVLGTDVTIGGSGDVAVLTFQIVDEAYTVDFSSATLRGAANDELTADLEGLSYEGIPASFKLVRNTPNPFNPVTTVGYHLPSESRVTIRVFDVAGRVVTTLVDGVVEPGRHTVVWNGTNEYGESVGSGVYFCTMETPEYRGSHKMTLLK